VRREVLQQADVDTLADQWAEPGGQPDIVTKPVFLDLLRGYDPQDVGNGQRIQALYGDIVRWCPEFKKYLVWDGMRWMLDDADMVRLLAQNVMTAFGVQAAKAGDESMMRFAAGCRRSSRITNALREAQPHLICHADQLDTDPWLLNFRNGTVDLRTSELLPHNPSNYITKLVEYDFRPGAECPLFLRFLERITGGGPDVSQEAGERSRRLILFLRRAFGYSLTGVTSEKVVFLLYGPHDNGKSTLLALFLRLLGPYAILLQIESLMARQYETNNSQADLADLKGARFVMTSETEEGQRLAEGKLKRITQGTGRIKAARKFENPIEFSESHKLWLDCNFLPVIRGHDEAIWRRLRTIPFDVVIPPEEQDRNLSAKLMKEAEGILAWAVEGAREWYAYGLPATTDVDDVGKEWRRDADQIGRFIDQSCTTVPNAQVSARALYSAYKEWAESSGERWETEKKFSDRMQERGFEKERKESGNLYLGIGLLAEG
jgi:putative DNA primase/helicase